MKYLKSILFAGFLLTSCETPAKKPSCCGVSCCETPTLEGINKEEE